MWPRHAPGLLVSIHGTIPPVGDRQVNSWSQNAGYVDSIKAGHSRSEPDYHHMHSKFALRIGAVSAAVPLILCGQEVVQLEKFEVTSQQRVQAIQDVPISVTAYSGVFLEDAGIREFKDLAPFVPGLFIQEQSPNNPGINIRGVTTDSGDPRSETRVSIFQDGVSISRSRGSVVELFDMERVEVLKGPQGTLFGRGAEVGALSLVQHKAKNATESVFTAGFGNYNAKQVSGVYNTPLVKDALFGRVAFTYTKRDGFIDNVADGSTLNGKETLAVRPSLRWQPTPQTTLDVIVNYQHDTPPGTAFKSGTIAPTGGDTSPFTAAELNRGNALGLDRTVWGATAILTHELSNTCTLTSTTGWRAYDSMEQFDADGSRLNLLEFAEDASGRQFSQEVRINFDSRDRVAGFFGVGYFHESGEQRVPFYGEERYVWPFLSAQFKSSLLAQGVPAALVSAAVPTLNPFAPQDTLPLTFAAFNNAALPASLRALSGLAGAALNGVDVEEYRNTAKTDAFDFFADGTYRITDRLHAAVGLRLTTENNTSGYEVINAAAPAHVGFLTGASPNLVNVPTNGLRETEISQLGWAGRAVVDYKLAPELNSFASVSRGRRPKSVVIDATKTTPLAEEVVWSYEVGLKGSLARGRVQWNAGVFQYDYTHFQTTVADPINAGRFIAQDAGNATGKGFELAVQGAINPFLSVFSSYGYTDATFDETGSSGQTQQYAGNSFRLTARHTVSIGATVTTPATSIGRFFATPVYQYKSQHYFEDNNAQFDYGLRQSGFSLVNLRGGWRSPGSRWELGVYVENLFDKQYLIDAGNTGGSFGIPTYIAGSPRTWGVTGSMHF